LDDKILIDMYSVKIRKSVMIAHSLPNPFFGPAQNLHGATYVVDAEFKTKTLNQYNVVIDIGEAHKILEQVLQPLAYKNLDELEIFEGQLTTTEFLAKYIHNKIAKACTAYFAGTLKITLGETHDAWATYEANI